MIEGAIITWAGVTRDELKRRGVLWECTKCGNKNWYRIWSDVPKVETYCSRCSQDHVVRVIFE